MRATMVSIWVPQVCRNGGLEIAFFEGVWHVDGMFSQIAKHLNPKRPMAESRGV